MKARWLAAALALAALLLAGCRFAVVESDSVRIEAPTPSPEPQPADN